MVVSWSEPDPRMDNCIHKMAASTQEIAIGYDYGHLVFMKDADKVGGSSEVTMCKLSGQVLFSEYRPCTDFLVVSLARIRGPAVSGGDEYQILYGGTSKLMTACTDLKDDQNAIPNEM